MGSVLLFSHLSENWNHTMSKLAGTQHGDAATFGIETAILAYLLVEFGEDNGGELQIPYRVNFSEPMCGKRDRYSRRTYRHAFPVRDDEQKPKHIGKDVVDRIREFRNLVHPAVALRRGTATLLILACPQRARLVPNRTGQGRLPSQGSCDF
jgi:hypothetical protein